MRAFLFTVLAALTGIALAAPTTPAPRSLITDVGMALSDIEDTLGVTALEAKLDALLGNNLTKVRLYFPTFHYFSPSRLCCVHKYATYYFPPKSRHRDSFTSFSTLTIAHIPTHTLSTNIPPARRRPRHHLRRVCARSFEERRAAGHDSSDWAGDCRIGVGVGFAGGKCFVE